MVFAVIATRDLPPLVVGYNRRVSKREILPFGLLAALAACSTFGTTAEDFGAIDASVEASVDGGAGCTGTTHTFCDDFDHGGLGANWNGKDIAAPVTFALDGARTVSAPSSALVTFPELTAFSDGATLTWSHLAPTKRLKCQTQVWVDTHATNGEPSVLMVIVPAGSDDLTAEISVNAQHMQLAVGRGSDATYPQAGTLATGRWTALGVRIDLDTLEVVATIDDQANITAKFPQGSTANTGLQVKLGMFSIGPGTTGASVRFDDFWCDAN
jgi:hypothetical protein